MTRNHALAALAVLIVACSAWLATSLFDSSEPLAIENELGPADVVDAATSTDLESTAPGASEPAGATRIVVAAEPAADEVQPAAAAGELGGLIGRVVEEDGTPVADTSVALVQVDAGLLLAADWARLGETPPELVIDSTDTDAEGKFRLGGAYDSSFQGLGIDLRGPRSTVRVVDAQLHHGEVTDVGDIVLRAGCTIVGRVIDEAGAPVAGARVRIVPAPNEDLDEFMQIGVQDFRADCAVAITKMIVEEEGSPVIELPPLVRAHIDDLPIPTTHTNADGEYRFEGAPIGNLIQGVDKPGLLGVGRTVTTTAGEVELEDAILTPGRTVHGIVMDDSGDPIEGVEVMAGAQLFFGEAGILHPAGRTGPDGRFSVSGCPLEGDGMACARRSPDEPWLGALASPGEELEIEFESTFEMTVRVVDFQGKTVRDARVELAPSFDRESPMGMIGAFMSLGAEPLDNRFDETEPGTYVCKEVTPGEYDISVRPKGLATARKRVDVWEGKADVTLICDRGQSIDVTVIDAATREGIPNARASIVGFRPPMFTALAVGRTTKEGHVALGPYTVRQQDEGEDAFSGWMGGLQILVQHPRYADGSIKLVEGPGTAEIALVRGGEIHGQIQWGSDAPQKVYTLMLENREGVDGVMEAFLPPRLGRSGLTGTFRFTNIPPGRYRLAVFERFLDGDPISLLIEQKEPTLIHREDEIHVEAGGRTELVIDLSPSGRGQTARVAGTISIDGRPAEGAEIRISGSGPGVKAIADASGHYETSDFLPGKNAYVRVRIDLDPSDGKKQLAQVHGQSIEPEPLTVHRLDLDLHSRNTEVQVTSAPNGEAIAGARVHIRPEQGWGGGMSDETDETGRAEVKTYGEGAHVVQVTADGYADSSTTINFSSAEFEGVVQVELMAPAPCAGICDLSAFDSPSTNMVFLRIESDGDSDWHRLDSDDLMDDRRAAFEVKGLHPGSYRAVLWIDGEETEEVPFELPEGGDEGLELVFSKS